MDRKDRPEWKWKQKAIDRWAEMLRQVLTDGWLKDVTLVPVPPSKTKDHPEYDDRLLQILQKLGAGQNLDIRELVVMKESIDPAHLREDRRSVRELIEKMDLDDELMKPPPSAIFIFDDVLTTGAHFKAVESVSEARERINEKLKRSAHAGVDVKLARGGIRDIEFLVQYSRQSSRVTSGSPLVVTC